MRKMAFAALVAVLALDSSIGTTVAQQTCRSQAVGKDGKPLAGAALNSFMKKCVTNACATKAVDKNGKPLAGAAKASFMKKCQTEAS